MSASSAETAGRAHLRVAAQAVIDQVNASGLSVGLDPGPTPRAVVRFVPQMICYLPENNHVIVPWWDEVPEEVRRVLRIFAGADAEKARDLFLTFFNRFYVAHEAFHWLLGNWKDVGPATMWQMEQETNRFAVAFWRNRPDGETFLASLERALPGILSRIPDPVPAGHDPAAYFGANYHKLGADPVQYGYFQFKQVLEAVEERANLDLVTLLEQHARDHHVGA